MLSFIHPYGAISEFPQKYLTTLHHLWYNKNLAVSVVAEF